MRAAAIFLSLFLFFLCPVIAQEKILTDKEQIAKILKERKDRFSGYMNSLQNKSGFFGGKTKKDLMESQKILVEIVRLDNRLISILNRQLDYKTFEKTEMNYQSLKESESQDQLVRSLATKNRELLILQDDNNNLRHSLRWRTSVMFIALATAVVAVWIPFYYFRKKESEMKVDGTGF
jgi:ABC-type phosphate transport system auxiliary subunit